MSDLQHSFMLEFSKLQESDSCVASLKNRNIKALKYLDFSSSLRLILRSLRNSWYNVQLNLKWRVCMRPLNGGGEERIEGA